MGATIWVRMPASSRTSRTAACSGVSPSSITPFGICQRISGWIMTMAISYLLRRFRYATPPADTWRLVGIACFPGDGIGNGLLSERRFDGLVELALDARVETCHLQNKPPMTVKDRGLRDRVLIAKNERNEIAFRI